MEAVADQCPNGCDLTGEPIPQNYIDAGYYREGATHYSRKIGVEVRGLYDGVAFWTCPDCRAEWLRDGLPERVGDWFKNERLSLE